MKPCQTYGTINCDGFQLQYIIEGDGKPILVIGSSLYDERVFSAELRRKNKWVFADHRGFGVVPGIKVDNSVFDLVVILDDIDKVRCLLGLKEVVIVGHSGHAFMAIEYAKKYQEFVTGVIITGCGPSNSDQRRKASAEYFERSASLERKTSFEEGMKSLVKKIETEPEKRFIHIAYVLVLRVGLITRLMLRHFGMDLQLTCKCSTTFGVVSSEILISRKDLKNLISLCYWRLADTTI